MSAAGSDPMPVLPLLQLTLHLLQLLAQLGVGALVLLGRVAQLRVLALKLLDAGAKIHGQQALITPGEHCLPN